MLNKYKFVRMLAIRGILSLSVTESGSVEKSAQMSSYVAEAYNGKMIKQQIKCNLKQWWYRGLLVNSSLSSRLTRRGYFLEDLL